MRTAIITLLVGGLPLAAYANQEWSQYEANERSVTQVTTTIDRAVYDGGIWITYEGQPMLVSLGSPSSMQSRGLPMWKVANGKTVTLELLNEPTDSRGRHRAERIKIDGKTIKLI
ncbi:MAG: hypothetical protein Q8R02_23085 [Hyphomonadaceae bacterium]|nr:hypothetical protein [Hyphomonadaceae bacterium]